MGDSQTLVPSWEFQLSFLFLYRPIIYPSYSNFSPLFFLHLLYIKAFPSSLLFSFSHPLVRSSLFLLYLLFLHFPSYHHSSPLPSYSSFWRQTILSLIALSSRVVNIRTTRLHIWKPQIPCLEHISKLHAITTKQYHNLPHCNYWLVFVAKV